MYYKISEEDLFYLEKCAYELNAIRELDIDPWNYEIPEDEDILEAINSYYDICES